VFDGYVAAAEDEVTDVLFYLVGVLIVLTFVFVIGAVDLQYYYMITSAGG
jgi:hypothetical protein